MANRIDPSLQTEKQEVVQEEPTVQEQPKVQQTPKVKVAKQPVTNPFIKGLRKGFVGLLGGGFLKMINFKKNWLFILFIVLILIFLIYNNLSIQSSRNKIEKLKDEKIKITTEYMRTKQKTTFLDDYQGQQLMEKFKENGYVQNKSLEYKIIVTKENEEK